MSNNLLIVESHNDQLFIERLKQEINNSDFEISTPICSIDDYECLGGLSLNRLQEKLVSIKKRIEKTV